MIEYYLSRYPRSIALGFGLLLTIPLIVLSVMGFEYFAHIPKKNLKVQRYNDLGVMNSKNRKFYKKSKRLGYKHLPNTKLTEIKYHKDELIYRATYTLDSHGRRSTPSLNHNTAEVAVIFVGCSYAFGIGVNDEETLPWQFSLLRPEFAVYNYGVAGWGPQNVLELFKLKFGRKIKQKKAIVIYLMIDDHFNRAIGNPELVANHGRNFPWYELDPNSGDLIRQGKFSDRKNLDHLVLNLELFKKINREYQNKFSTHAQQLTAAMINQSRLEMEKDFISLGFHILIYPSDQTNRFENTFKMLEKDKFKILDYRELINKSGSNQKTFFPHDFHPTAYLNKVLAKELAKSISVN